MRRMVTIYQQILAETMVTDSGLRMDPAAYLAVLVCAEEREYVRLEPTVLVQRPKRELVLKNNVLVSRHYRHIDRRKENSAINRIVIFFQLSQEDIKNRDNKDNELTRDKH